jgi:hypothetical protein
MDQDDIKWVPIKDLVSEEGANDLANSPDMEPYLRLAMSVLGGVDPAANLKEIAQLPLEKRYIWRVASALKWGFADFDDMSVRADRDTLPAQDLAKAMDLLRLRPMQFCAFLKALVGAQEMKRIMIQAISTAGRGGS